MKAVICGFPAVGKSTITKEAESLGLKKCFVHYNDFEMEYQLTVPRGPGIPVFDSDSSLFDKSKFPKNYVDHIENILNQDWMEDVIILVSSHDSVREMLRERGIEYSLVYPQIELKAEYIERYKERGSSDQFIGMMENAWTKFITDCEEDPTKKKSILSEGEYLVDYVKLLLDAKVNGTESLEASEITATIIDVNASDPLVVVEPDAEVPPPNDPSVVNTPEQSEIATLTAEGDQSQFEDDDEEDPDQTHHVHHVDGTESEGIDRLALIEAKLEMQNDLDVLEPVVLDCQNEELRSGLEGYEDHGPVFTAAAADINARYHVQIEPTLAGLEGFVDELKKAFAAVGKKLKGEEAEKANLAIIKKYLYESEKAFSVYASEKWQKEQKFINVGKVKLQVPELLATINGPGDVETILKLINKRTVDAFDKYFKNSEQRLRTAIKIFNAFKGKPADTEISEVDKMLPITPELLTGGVKDSGLSDIKTSTKTVELPVLNKDAIDAICKVAELITETSLHFIRKDESTIDIQISEDDFYDSKFWDEHHAAKQTTAVWNAGTCFGDTPEYERISQEYGKQLLPIAKFLEQWVLASVK